MERRVHSPPSGDQEPEAAPQGDVLSEEQHSGGQHKDSFRMADDLEAVAGRREGGADEERNLSMDEGIERERESECVCCVCVCMCVWWGRG